MIRLADLIQELSAKGFTVRKEGFKLNDYMSSADLRIEKNDKTIYLELESNNTPNLSFAQINIMSAAKNASRSAFVYSTSEPLSASKNNALEKNGIVVISKARDAKDIADKINEIFNAM